MSLADDIRRTGQAVRARVIAGGAEQHWMATLADNLDEFALRADALEARAVPPGARIAGGSGVIDLADARHRAAISDWLAGRSHVIDGGAP